MKQRLRRSFGYFLILAALHFVKNDRHQPIVHGDLLLAGTSVIQSSLPEETSRVPDHQRTATGDVSTEIAFRPARNPQAKEANSSNRSKKAADLENAIRAAATSKAVPPSGWRRTNRGWERVDDWSRLYPELYVQPRSLQDWMDHHREQQPNWLRSAMGHLSQLPPLSIAGMQMLAIFVIARQSSRGARNVSTQATQSVVA